MILVFPDADTFRLALTGGFVLPDVTLAPAAVSFEPGGRLFLETDAKLPKKGAEELKRLGVVGARRHHADPLPVSCWPQVVPVEKGAIPLQLSSQAPVLFDLPSAEELSALVSEMLRFGNDRQSFRWVTGEDDANPRVLLRVIGPPYYTLLRALDHPSAAGVRAYVEQAPRVWVEVGHTHPLAEQIKLTEGQILLIGPPHDWRFLPDAPFRDVYEALNFTLPSASTEWQDAPIESKLTVPLKLVPGNAADTPELWVLRGSAAEQLDTFVRDADDRITQRLKFAVGTDPAGGQVIVLRTTPSKLAPPVLPLTGAIGFKPFWKIPNLYVPVGTRLHPQLRRDVVRKLLADDTDRLVWLFPGPDGTFTPETLPEDSFRPLEDWVDYVIESNHAPLAAWVGATQFGFEGFVCSENQPPKPKDDKGPPKGRRGDSDNIPVAVPTDVPRTAKRVEAKSADKFVPEAVEVKPPSEWLVRRQELEERFLAVEGSLDAPERQGLWPELAAANAGYGDATEAGVCWANALWETPTPSPAWLDRWLRSEFPELPRLVPAAEFDRRMKPTDPTPGEMRQFATVLLSVVYQPTPPKWLTDRLPTVQSYLEANEAKLPVRTAWLAAHRLSQLGGADVLGLARVRDRLLQRLLEEGLNPERNLPTFLRFAGSKDTARARLVLEKTLELHRLVRAWADKGTKVGTALTQSDGGATLGYIDLLFAFGLARIGNESATREKVESARRTLETIPIDHPSGTGFVGRYLWKAYRYRVEQTLAGKPHSGLLPLELLDELAEFQKLSVSVNGQTNPLGTAYYSIIRLREQSHVLEPQEKQEAESVTISSVDPLRKALYELWAVQDASTLIRRVRDLYKNGVSGKQTPDGRLLVLQTALPLSGRAGESFTVEMISLIPDLMQSPLSLGTAPLDLAKRQGRLIGFAMFLAAHFNRTDLVHRLVDLIVWLVGTKPDDQKYELISFVAGQSLRSLRKLGLRDDVDRLLQRLHDEILKGQTPAQLKARMAAKPDMWGRLLQSLLHLAGGWLTFGLTAQADTVLDLGRTELLSTPGLKLQLQDWTRLTQAYISALSHGSADYGLPQIAELFREMPANRIANGYTTAAFYSRFHLNIAEEVVFALTGDDFAIGPAGRRWLEEDEYLIRRRIHRDMKRHLAASGL